MFSRWRHQMETFSALLALCAENLPVTGEFPSQRPVTRIFDVFFDLRLNKRLNKQSWRRWFETPSRSLWRHCIVRRHNWVHFWHVFWFVYKLHSSQSLSDIHQTLQRILMMTLSWGHKFHGSCDHWGTTHNWLSPSLTSCIICGMF